MDRKETRLADIHWIYLA